MYPNIIKTFKKYLLKKTRAVQRKNVFDVYYRTVGDADVKNVRSTEIFSLKLFVFFIVFIVVFFSKPYRTICFRRNSNRKYPAVGHGQRRSSIFPRT